MILQIYIKRQKYPKKNYEVSFASSYGSSDDKRLTLLGIRNIKELIKAWPALKVGIANCLSSRRTLSHIGPEILSTTAYSTSYMCVQRKNVLNYDWMRYEWNKGGLRAVRKSLSKAFICRVSIRSSFNYVFRPPFLHIAEIE